MFIDKKKAPAPPPRTVSTNSTGNPIATPINASSSISNGDIKDNVVEDETHKCNNFDIFFLRSN